MEAAQMVWKARFIGAPSWQEQNMPVFRTDFTLGEGVRKARLSVCGLGNFSLYVNGVWVNEGVIEPGWTNYRKTCLYSTYEVGSLLREGENRITVLLGNGMYRVEGGRYAKLRNVFGPLKLILQCEILLQSGGRSEILTGPDWRCAKGPIAFSCVYGGEDFDARVDSWKRPTGACGGDWMPVTLQDAPEGELKPALQPAVSVRRGVTPVSSRCLSPRGTVYDFGRNFAGRPVIRVTGEKGQTVRICPGELLGPDGTVNQRFSGGPHSYTYTLGDEPAQSWMPYFTYYGFRYLEVQSDARVLEVSAAETFADVPAGGGFACSNALFNQIHTIIRRAMESNMQSVFTDCPHREKLGWLEQLHLIGPGLLYNFDLRAMGRKILNDMAEAQLENGLMPNIAPEYVVFDQSLREGAFRDSPEWGAACILLPWYLYEAYGDRSVLSDFYPMMRRYLEYLISRSEGALLHYGLGDWMDVGHIGGVSKHTPMSVTASAMFYNVLDVMARIAPMVGSEEDGARFAACRDRCRRAFNDSFLHPEGYYASGSQTSDAMPLFLDVVPETFRGAVLDHLAADVRAHHDHATGGDVGHPFLLRALAQCGRSDVVEDMLARIDSPSYGFQIVNGATALCEDWDGPAAGRERCSQNHFMLGAAEEWFYRYLAGIRPRMDLPQKCVRFQPYIARQVDWVNSWVATPFGKAEILWQKDGKTVRIDCRAPKGLAAELYLPGRAEPIRFCGEQTETVAL